MGSKGCDFFCFKDCADKYETHVMKKDIEVNEKLSLKKMTSIYSQNQYQKPLQKIKSVSKLQTIKCPTDRSNQSLLNNDELYLIRKKCEIEKELSNVNESISTISSQYKRKIQKLDQIRKQIDSLLRKGNP